MSKDREVRYLLVGGCHDGETYVGTEHTMAVGMENPYEYYIREGESTVMVIKR